MEKKQIKFSSLFNNLLFLRSQMQKKLLVVPLNFIFADMLVPSMTLEEIRKEIEKDFPIVIRKAGYLGQKLKKDNAPIRNKKIVKIFDYYSKYKNNWILKTTITKKTAETSFMVFYYGNNGLVAITLSSTTNFLNYYTAHFFKRYNERKNLNLILPIDIIKSFLNSLHVFQTHKLDPISTGVYKMYTYSDVGMLLGIWNDNLEILKMNTFITHDMLKGSQIEMKEEMKAELEKYKKDAGILD